MEIRAEGIPDGACRKRRFYVSHMLNRVNTENLLILPEQREYRKILPYKLNRGGTYIPIALAKQKWVLKSYHAV